MVPLIISALHEPVFSMGSATAPLIRKPAAFWYFSGPALLFFSLFRRRKTSPDAAALPMYLIFSSCALALVAAMTMFNCICLSRYTAEFFLLPYLTTLPIILSWLCDATKAPVLRNWQRIRLPMTIAFFGMLAGSVALAAIVKPEINEPHDPELLEAISELPKDAVIGGFVTDLDFSPLMTNRSTLFNPELAIAYHRGYFLPIMSRMDAIRDIVLTRDADIFREKMKETGLTHLLVDSWTLLIPRVSNSFRGFFGEELIRHETAHSISERTVLAQTARQCSMAVFGDVLVLEASCLIRVAERL